MGSVFASLNFIYLSFSFSLQSKDSASAVHVIKVYSNPVQSRSLVNKFYIVVIVYGFADFL